MKAARIVLLVGSVAAAAFAAGWAFKGLRPRPSSISPTALLLQ
jgi:hypothetical protein